MTSSFLTPEETARVAQSLRERFAAASADFQEARRKLKVGEFICGVLPAEAALARHIVRNRLAPWASVESWAWCHNLPGVQEMGAADWFEYRQRWLDALIKEFAR